MYMEARHSERSRRQNTHRFPQARGRVASTKRKVTLFVSTAQGLLNTRQRRNTGLSDMEAVLQNNNMEPKIHKDETPPEAICRAQQLRVPHATGALSAAALRLLGPVDCNKKLFQHK